MANRLNYDDYKVAWIAVLPIEAEAALGMLDKEHPGHFESVPGDDYIYIGGEINGHNVVVATWPVGQNYGVVNAAALVTQVKIRFPNIWISLLVGVAAGIPNLKPSDQSRYRDVRLGDVLVCIPEKASSGIIQYDLGQDKEVEFLTNGRQTETSAIVRSAIGNIQLRKKKPFKKGHDFDKIMDTFLKADEDGKFRCPSQEADQLFSTSFELDVLPTLISRAPRDETERTRVWYGNIGSGNSMMRNARRRDELRDKYDLIGLEMEAAGIMNTLPAGVIRGVCDYGDGQKNKDWQPYAAAVAAAYAKGILMTINPKVVHIQQEPVIQPSYYLPFLQNSRFVGREIKLAEITQKLLVTKDCQKLALVGLGGVGKTQLALEFAYTAQSTCPDLSIFWISAVSAETFEQACVEIARKLHIAPAVGDQEDVKELIRRHLSAETAGRWLLIVDNADDTEVVFGSESARWSGIDGYLPHREDGLIVFTTRHSKMAVDLAGSDVIELDEMSQEEAFTFLEKSLIRKEMINNIAITNELLKELTYLPLAIAQAAAYLNKNKTPIAQYLKLLRNTEQDIVNLMSKEFRDHTRYRGAKNAVATTWLVSFDQILKFDHTAADLLSFMSCIEPKAIPRSILPSVQPEERMERAIGTLCGYAFVTHRDEEEIYDMHRLVHLATRIWVGNKNRTSEVMDNAIRHIADSFPYNDYENRELWRQQLPHALKLLESTEKAESAERDLVCWKVGQCLRVDGRVREAVRWLEMTSQWTKDNLDEEDPSRLSSQHELAGAYLDDGQVGKAIKLLEHVLAIREKVLVEDHRDRLTSQHELARAYLDDGQVSKAIKLLEHVLAVQEKVLVEEHPDRLTSQHALAIAYDADGQVGRAVELLEYVVSVEAKVLRDDHPSRLISERVLASMYADLKPADEASMPSAPVQLGIARRAPTALSVREKGLKKPRH